MTETWEPDGFDQQQSIDPEFEDAETLDELPSFARSDRRRPAVLMVTVIAGGLAGIVLMRSLTGGIGQVMADTGIEQTVNGFLDFMRDGRSSDADEKPEIAQSPFEDLVTDHYASLQVPAESLKSNPFIIPWSARNEPGSVMTETLLTPRERRSIRMKELEAVKDLLELQLVMTGSNPIATINQQATRVGGSIRMENSDLSCRLLSVSSHSVDVEVLDESLGLRKTITIPLRRHE